MLSRGPEGTVLVSGMPRPPAGRCRAYAQSLCSWALLKAGGHAACAGAAEQNCRDARGCLNSQPQRWQDCRQKAPRKMKGLSAQGGRGKAQRGAIVELMVGSWTEVAAEGERAVQQSS